MNPDSLYYFNQIRDYSLEKTIELASSVDFPQKAQLIQIVTDNPQRLDSLKGAIATALSKTNPIT